MDCINRSITCKSREVILLLYMTVLRHHMEYCVLFLAPQFEKGMINLERVNWKVTKMIRALGNKERVKELGVFNMGKR